ncbi:hypothetical protein BJ944DRAFT_239205 [Cunninghamella echinulata]|nr:hypothetical protein BJ944DRAFT_239205 [Cunninghamella echinulata]
MTYWKGSLGTTINLGESVIWFTRSAAQKYAASHWALGQMALENGDQDVAIVWWRKAIELKYAPAMRALARLLLQNNQVNGDYITNDSNLDRAMELLAEAVENNDAESLAYLGQLHQVKATQSEISSSSSSSSHVLSRNNNSGILSNRNSVSSSTMNNTLSTYNNNNSNYNDDHCNTDKERNETDDDAHSTNMNDTDDDDAAELILQRQQQRQGLATRCFEQAAEMGHVESMFLAAESWHSQQQYAAALEYYEKAAQHGHLLARVMCARYKLNGLGGMEINTSLGYKELLDCAIEKNCVDAYNSLGQCNELGIGTDQNDKAALDWYLKSAEQTQDAEAMFRIGKMYAQKRVEPPNGHHKDIEALKWYRFASETRNHPLAHYCIGLYFLRGVSITNEDDDGYKAQVTIIPIDRDVARFHFLQASEQGDMNSMYELGQLLLADDDDPNSLLKVEDRQDGFNWLFNSAQMGQKDAQRELGKLYHSGKSFQHTPFIDQDSALAYDYFTRAAQQGDKTSMLFIGIYYEHGIHVSMNLTLAREWYEMAAHSGWWLGELALAQLLHQDMDSREDAYRYFSLAYEHAPVNQRQQAAVMLARYHLNGWGNTKLRLQEAANQLITLAEEDSHVKVYLEVAQCYEFGIGVPQNYSKAFEWYEKVVLHHGNSIQSDLMDEEDQEDLAEAMFRLAEFHRNGYIGSIDHEKANQLYYLAAQKGSKDAQTYLATQQ